MTAPNFQSMAKSQGDAFRDLCVKTLVFSGFDAGDIKTEVKFGDVGVTLDIVANNSHGIALAIECKGSWRGERPGCKRTDTVLKAIGEAYLLSQSLSGIFPPMLLMTSHVASDNAPRLMLGGVSVSVIADVINPNIHFGRLKWWANADEEAIRTHIRQYERVEEILIRNWNGKHTPRFSDQFSLFAEAA